MFTVNKLEDAIESLHTIIDSDDVVKCVTIKNPLGDLTITVVCEDDVIQTKSVEYVLLSPEGQFNDRQTLKVSSYSTEIQLTMNMTDEVLDNIVYVVGLALKQL